MGIRAFLSKITGSQGSSPIVDQQVRDMQYSIEYLSLEVSRLKSLVRYLSANLINELPISYRTRESFDYQWRDSPDGNWTETRPELKLREPNLVIKYTKLSKEWFKGKKVLDAGCGSGRFSWAMASMGAVVYAVDQSEAGVFHTKHACAEFGEKVEVLQQDLTQPLTFGPEFDLVWSHGVLHHTGNTFGAFSNIARLVKPGGYIFLMLYGEPTGRDPGEFAYYAEVEKLRRETCTMSFSERYEFLRKLKGEDVGGWFDAVSPTINDTYSLYEIELWLKQCGFKDIERTICASSHYVIARRCTKQMKHE
jgi:2-polyprenyl-3-methyl-5-hydroxy-6-metoxy-1,4-benzoquinol methylase